MRKISYILFGLFLFLNSGTKAQVYDGNLSLFTQAQVDAFNYTEVTGNLLLDGAGTITNFDGLSELTTVGGALAIGNIQITNLNGLSNLTSIGGRLTIHTKFVTSLSALSNLTHAHAIYLLSNDALPEISTGLDVIAFPNPSATSFTINVKSNSTKEKITMQVIDMYGRVIETRNVNAASPVKFGDRYRPGVYYVRVLQGKQHEEVKLIKLLN